MRNNDTQHIVRLSRAVPERTVLAKHAFTNTLHHEEVSEEEFSGFSVSRGVVGKLVTLLLLPMIFIYPLAPAYAADEATSSAATTTTDTPPPPPEEVPPPSDTNSLAADLSSAAAGAVAIVTSLFTSDESTTTEANTADTSSTDTTASSTDTTSGDTASSTPEGDTASSTESTDTASSTDSTDSTDTASSTESGDASTTPIFGGGDTSASSTDTTASSTEATSTDAITEASSTDTILPPEKSAQEIAREMLAEKEDSLRASIRKEVEDEFTKGCVSLDTTGYYCLKDRPNSGDSLTPSSVITDVSSMPDAGGQYKQIFITRSGNQEQLTHSVFDNSFPATDVSGKSVVWQGDVKGRWQIFYSTPSATGTPEIFQVTHSNESNFNPKVDGNDIVWQGWVDGNWEVFLAEHLSPENYLSSTTLPENNKLLSIDHTWKVTRITTNSGHDMFPSVAGGLVTWQSFQDNAWNVYVYSMKTGATQKISKSGEKSEQPRFAITWDERTTEGNARMVGYDIASGKTIDLTDEARQVNDQKPYTPTPTPVSQPDQAALPITGTGTSTTAKSEGDASSTPNGLDI